MSAPPVRFVIVAAPRTGSNLLCTLLDSHPAIVCHHELFNPTGIFWARGWRSSGVPGLTRELRDRNPQAFLQGVWRMDLGHGHIGFKMTGRQNPAALGGVVADPGVRKILLQRRNRIRTYVSRLIAERTDVWELYDDDHDAAAAPAVKVDPDQLHSAISDDNDFYRELEQALAGQRFLQVIYERLFDIPERSRLLEFLDVPDPVHAASRLSTTSVRRLPAELDRTVSNLPDLTRALAGTELAADLDPARWSEPVEA